MRPDLCAFEKLTHTTVIVINEFVGSERSKAVADVSLSILCRVTANGQFGEVIQAADRNYIRKANATKEHARAAHDSCLWLMC